MISFSCLCLRSLLSLTVMLELDLKSKKAPDVKIVHNFLAVQPQSDPERLGFMGGVRPGNVRNPSSYLAHCSGKSQESE